MIGDVRLVEETVGVAGDIYVLDGAVLGASLLGKVSPSTIKKFMICVQVRLKFRALDRKFFQQKIRISTNSFETPNINVYVKRILVFFLFVGYFFILFFPVIFFIKLWLTNKFPNQCIEVYLNHFSKYYEKAVCNLNSIYPFRLYEKPVCYNICILIFQEAYPVKLKEVHVINTSAIVERFLSLVKPFLKEKIRKRVRITFI